MSRWAQDEPDFDRFNEKPIDVQDLPVDEYPDPPVDPAEHAAHDMIDALSRFEQEIAQATDADRMFTIWHALQRVTARCLEVADKAGDKTDAIVRGRR